MSMDSAGIFCTGCKYTSREVYRPICVRYVRNDGKTVEVGRTKGWCHNCNDYADIEKIDKEQLLDYLHDLRHQSGALNQKLTQLQTGLLAKLFNQYQIKQIKWQLEQVHEREAETLMLVEFFEARTSKARCLKCFSDQTESLSFNQESQLSDDFMHHCGGKLRIAYDDIGLRLNIRRTVYILNTEGEFQGKE